MQTFFPELTSRVSLAVLDNKMLGKQRVETKQIVIASLVPSFYPHWANHPAVLMWKGHERALLTYGRSACLGWKARGFRDSLESQFQAAIDVMDKYFVEDIGFPSWAEKGLIQPSHQAALYRKDPEYYIAYRPRPRSSDVSLEYYWPTKNGWVAPEIVYSQDMVRELCKAFNVTLGDSYEDLVV